MDKQITLPGREWLDVITRPTLAAFAAAFSIDPQLSASVLHTSIFGAARIRSFFDATRAMYDRIAFIRETGPQARRILEWDGSYRGQPIEGVTIIERDAVGVISNIRVFHLPFDQLVAFADDLALRLANTSQPEGT